jgi:hypothetical protein
MCGSQMSMMPLPMMMKWMDKLKLLLLQLPQGQFAWVQTA